MTTGHRSGERTGEVAETAAERMMFFSDAVVAIAMTLLAIDLPVPEGNDVEELLTSFGANSHDYLMFFISFVVVAAHWMVHHRIFGWVHRVNGLVIRLDLFWLFLVVINPFLTKVLADGESNVLRFGVYSVAQALMMLTMATMIAVVARNHWFVEDAPAYLNTRGSLRSLLSAVGFLLAIPVYLVVGQWAFAVYAIVPLAGSRLLRRWTGVPTD
jgi:uncharacterized membrane protein